MLRSLNECVECLSDYCCMSHCLKAQSSSRQIYLKRKTSDFVASLRIKCSASGRSRTDFNLISFSWDCGSFAERHTWMYDAGVTVSACLLLHGHQYNVMVCLLKDTQAVTTLHQENHQEVQWQTLWWQNGSDVGLCSCPLVNNILLLAFYP